MATTTTTPTTGSAVDLGAFKERQQKTWATGDFGMIATAIVIVGEYLCEAVDLRAGQKVIDVATGSGNTAIAAARRNCEVTGIDFVPALLERGRERAEAERLHVDFRDGDAESIPFGDASFDVVLSTFGVMFAPDQEKAAAELLRVCRPGGRIGLACWTPEGFTGRWFRASSKYLPPPPEGVRPPIQWGTEERVRELLGAGVSSLRMNRRDFVFRFRSPEDWLTYFKKYFGPTIRAFETVAPEKRPEMEREILDLARSFNISGDDTLVVPAEYLEVVAVRA